MARIELTASNGKVLKMQNGESVVYGRKVFCEESEVAYWQEVDETECVNTMLEEAKAQKVADIEAYDTSDAVNGFTYGGQTMWLDKATRVGLVNAIDCTMMMGEEQVTFGIGNVSVTLPCATAKQMMAALEVYALKCYNVTLAHKNAVLALETAEEVAAYDITAGYPEKLAF